MSDTEKNKRPKKNTEKKPKKKFKLKKFPFAQLKQTDTSTELYTELYQVDPETGNFIKTPMKQVTKKVLKGERWFMGMSDLIEWAITDSELSDSACKILLYIMTQMDANNIFRMPQSQMAERLKKDKGNISKWMKELVDRKVLVHTGETIGKTKVYLVNPHVAYKGNKFYLKKFKREFDRKYQTKNGQSLSVIEGGLSDEA